MGNSQGLNFLNGVKMDTAQNATAQRRHAHRIEEYRIQYRIEASKTHAAEELAKKVIVISNVSHTRTFLPLKGAYVLHHHSVRGGIESNCRERGDSLTHLLLARLKWGDDDTRKGLEAWDAGTKIIFIICNQ